MSELPDQLEAEPLKLVLLDQLIQVDGEQLEGDAGVRTEREVVEPANINQEYQSSSSTNRFWKEAHVTDIQRRGLKV